MTNITHIVGLWNAEKKSQLAKLAIIVPWRQQEEKVWVYSGVEGGLELTYLKILIFAQ